MELTGELERAAVRFAALASRPRIQIIRLLLAAFRQGGMPASHIQAKLSIPGSTLTHHLECLKVAGLIKSRRDGRWIWYCAEAEGLREMVNFLYQECCSCGPVDLQTVTNIRSEA